MRTLILIFSIFFFSSSSAHEFREYGFAMTTNNNVKIMMKLLRYLKN